MTDEVGDTDYGVQVGISFVGQVLTATFGFVGSIYLARVVGAGGYGLFYISYAIAQFMENPASGWARACRKRMTETSFDESAALGSYLIITTGLLVVGSVVSFLILPHLTANPLIPVVVPVLFGSIVHYWGLVTILSGRANFGLKSWMGVGNTLIQTSVQITLVAFGWGVWGMVVGAAVGPLMMIPVVLWVVGVRPTVPSRHQIKSIGQFAKWSIPQGFVGTALSRVDIVLLGWIVAASASGRYQVALKLTLPAVFIGTAVQSGLSARISNRVSRGVDWKGDLYNSLSYISFFAVPIFFGSMVIGGDLAYTVFGKEFRGIGAMVILLALKRVIDTQVGPHSKAIEGLDRPDLNFKMGLVKVPLNAILGVVLLLEFGAIGVIVASVVAALIDYFVKVWWVHSLADVQFTIPKPFREQVFVGSAMVIVCYLFKQLVSFSMPVETAVVIVIGALFYIFGILVISDQFRGTVRGIGRDIVA